LIDAAVALEQVIKYDVSKKLTGPAIYNLGAIKIKQRDFYGAHFTFQRAVELGVEIEEQKILRSYVDAILCLVRRNFKEGVAALSKIIKKKHLLIQEYMGNCLAYRGYAYSSLEMHDKAVKDLLAAQKAQELDNASLYNLLISQAILAKDQTQALSLIQSAADLFPKNIEPLEYKSAIFFEQAVQSKSPAVQSKDLLDQAVKIRDSDSDLYFYRGIVLYYNGKTIDAVYDFEKAIEKAEDNVASHFLARGLCSARLKMFKEAIQDFSIVIQLDEKSAVGHLFRARSLFLIEDFESAQSDFLKALELSPNDFMVQSQALDFLMLAGSLEEAMKTCEVMCSASCSPESLNQKVKCLVLQEKIDLAVKELAGINAMCKSPKTSFDSELLSIFLVATEGPAVGNKVLSLLQAILSYKNEGNICKNFHVHWLKGTVFMYLGELEKARAEFSSVIVRKKKKEQVMEKNNAELIYNLALCFLIENKYEEALQQLMEICNYLDENDRGKVLLLVGMLKYALNQNREAKSILTEAFKYDPDIVGNFLEEKPDLQVLPLDCESSLLSKYSSFKVTIGDNKPILLKPSLGYPRPSLCNFEFNIESEILKLFTMSLIKSKPETPWLNRVKGSIQFTDEIQNIESESIGEDPIEKSEDSDVFSEKSLRKYKSLEIMIHSPQVRKKSEDFDSSLSEILDDLDELNF
jgi:tetratricopeptide (TPR) repeat protein